MFTRQTGASDLHQTGITGQGVTVAILDSGSAFDSGGAPLQKDTNGNVRVLATYNTLNENISTSVPCGNDLGLQFVT